MSELAPCQIASVIAAGISALAALLALLESRKAARQKPAPTPLLEPDVKPLV